MVLLETLEPFHLRLINGLGYPSKIKKTVTKALYFRLRVS